MAGTFAVWILWSYVYDYVYFCASATSEKSNICKSKAAKEWRPKAICSPTGAGCVDAWHGNSSYKILFQSKSKWIKWRKVFADCVSTDGAGVWRWYCNEATPLNLATRVIMHHPARSNFLISPTVVTLISVGRTHRCHRIPNPQVQRLPGTFLWFVFLLLSRFETCDIIGERMQMLLKQKSDHLGFDEGPKGCVCEREHYFWFQREPAAGPWGLCGFLFPFSYLPNDFRFDLPFFQPRCCAGSSGWSGSSVAFGFSACLERQQKFWRRWHQSQRCRSSPTTVDKGRWERICEGVIADSRGVKINRLGENWGETRLISLLSLRL